ncbi:MAG TPA: NUDIX domain-containing protein [Ktedonobacteraceae bacterium]|nr:NUDIX domain-containing protein [Ktedonobacteraceae bacterium]
MSIEQSIPTALTPTELYSLGARRFRSDRWASMALNISAELQKHGFDPVPPDLLANLTWVACMQAWGPETAHNVDKHCTRKVAGVLIWQGTRLLLQERLTGASGMAPSAGHLEASEDAKEAIRREAEEETGILLAQCTLIGQGRRFEQCKRYGSDYHDWSIFEGYTEQQELRLNPFESKRIGWYEPYEVLELAKRTEEYLRQRISSFDWQQRPGLEVVWYWWMKELGILDRLQQHA